MERRGGTLLEGQDRALRMRTTKKEVWLREVAKVRDRGGQWRKAVGTAYAVVATLGKLGQVRGGGAMTVRQYMEPKTRRDAEAMEQAIDEGQIHRGEPENHVESWRGGERRGER